MSLKWRNEIVHKTWIARRVFEAILWILRGYQVNGQYFINFIKKIKKIHKKAWFTVILMDKEAPRSGEYPIKMTVNHVEEGCEERTSWRARRGPEGEDPTQLEKCSKNERFFVPQACERSERHRRRSRPKNDAWERSDRHIMNEIWGTKIEFITGKSCSFWPFWRVFQNVSFARFLGTF